MRGYVFDLQKYSVHDGPGIRTLIFLKGCPLRCVWCCNPESQAIDDEIMHYPDLCLGVDRCGLCLGACEAGALLPQGRGITLSRQACIQCGKCTRVCHPGALKSTRQEMPVEDVYDYAIQDRAFYRRSGGGVTLSGGEPLYQFDFSLALSAYFRSKGISVVVETTGYSPWEKIKALAEHADMFLYDIKHMDPEMHLEYTGVGNEVILENIIKLEKMGVPIKPRVPLIPGINDDHDNLSRTASFIARNLHSVKSVGLLPYHRLGLPKYQQLARHCDVSMVLPVSRSQWRYYDRVATVFASQGLRYTIGS